MNKSKEWRERSSLKALQVYLSPNLIERLDYACSVSEKSKSEIVRQLIRSLEHPDNYRKII